jgi:hypothetical protein
MIRYSNTVTTPGFVCGKLSFEGCSEMAIF